MGSGHEQGLQLIRVSGLGACQPVRIVESAVRDAACAAIPDRHPDEPSRAKPCKGLERRRIERARFAARAGQFRWRDGARGVRRLLHGAGVQPVPAATADLLHEIIGLDASQAVAAASERLLALIERHRLSIVAALHGGDDLAPVFESADDGSSPANLWAVGFLRGIDAQSDQWADIDENQALADLLAPFDALAAERDFETGEVAEPLPAPRHKLVDDMIDAAFAYYEWFEPARRRYAAPQTVRHDQPVPGRNAACPCGSGRKFKQCCGAGR
ncbi:MAG: UPF0149 family protein [Burkholderiaceae bacterium]